MSVEVTMPQLSDTMSEGTILNWLKKEGDYVKRGDALAEVATDKADLEPRLKWEPSLRLLAQPLALMLGRHDQPLTISPRTKPWLGQ